MTTCKAGVQLARRLTTALALAAGVALLPQATAAQRVSHDVNMLLNADGTQGLDLRTVRPNSFQLYAAGDAALSGGRSTGNHGWSMSNYADCTNVLYSCQNQRMVRADIAPGTSALWFYNSWIAGAPPSQWRKLRDVAPSINNALGGGWTAGFNEELTGGFTRFGPADLTLGSLFAGVASTGDGTCRDNTGFGNAFVPAGIPLLPQSVCLDTWGSNGWEGARKSTVEDWAAWATMQGPNFNFDFWRLPANLTRDGFFGNLLHTYGETTDYYQNILNAFGSVVPGGTGNPALQGYPLGLKIRFDAFNFAVPSVNSVKFVRALVINRSEDVYGTGVDYDSLFFGISPGDLGAAQTGTAHYYLPHLGAIVRVRAGANTATNPCNDSFREPVFACAPTAGWQSGSQAIIVLKSPIGDLRNKLFTRTAAGTPCTPGTDPFCNPAHPLASDTFTVNQGRMCGFGQCNTFVWVGGGARSGFGFLSGDENNVLAGRDINAEAASRAWSTFRSPVWPNRAVFTKYQPDPNWDYNNDGTPDTLSLTSCHTNGCVGLASDTLPGGFVNLSSNVGGHHSAGPFSLGAGDTTSFWYAVIGDRDSVATMSQLAAAIDLYLNFFLAPEAPPQAQVVSTQLTPATDALGTTNSQVQIFFSDDPSQWQDPFLTKLASDIATSAPGTPLNDLANLNGGPAALAALVAARAADNLERIEVYKSCDGGGTFTDDGDCVGDPTSDVNGGSVGLGWSAYRTFEVDSPNGIPSSFTDGNVQGGRSYLYVIIGKSRGATFLLNTASGPDTVVFAPSIRNVLSRSTSDPNVVSVYVPASRNAGFIPASVSVTARPAEGTVPLDLDFSEAVTPGNYTATFGTRVIVQRDSVVGASAFRSRVIVQTQVTADVAGVATPTIIRSDTTTRPNGDVFPFAGAGTTAAPVVIGAPDTVRTTTTYNGLSFVVAGNNTVYFGASTLTGSAATPSGLFRLSDYPGFIVSADNSVAGSFNSGSEAHIRGAASLARLNLGPEDTITPRAVVNGFMPQFQESSALSTKTAAGGGLYELTWTDGAFGGTNGFTLNRTNPAATESEVSAALQGRTVGLTGLTDAATAALTGIPQTDLVPVRVPFTIRNLTYNRDVTVAMRRRVSNRIVLGTAQDTMSIVVPEDEWIPGDALVFIESVTRDSTTGTGVVLSGGQPIQVTSPDVTFTSAVIGCNTAVRLTCNPIPQGAPGATGWAPISAGDRTQFEYYVGFKAGTQFAFTVTEPVSGDDITSITDSALSLVRVVPNPFIIYSAYQNNASDARVLFTNLPPRGTLRIYTVSGQFVQQITWESGDLLGDGDLFFNLRTREGIDMASGLYLWVLNAPSNPTDANSAQLRAAGKFVIIRGSAQ